MIVVAIAAPLVLGVVLVGFSDRVAHGLRPRAAVVLLTGLALSVALCSGLVLSALALLMFVQTGPIPRLGHWSAAAISTSSGTPRPLGALAAAAVGICLIASVMQVVRSVGAHVRAWRAARMLEPNAGDFVVVNDEVPLAYTVAAPHGPIVVSGAMMRALTGDERRVLLAHERSHLRHQHYLYLQAARLAASANPLLWPTAAAVARAIERWADEDAAAAVGDRDLAARALARAALARSGRLAPVGALAAADGDVVVRARALLSPPHGPARTLTGTVVAAALLSWAAAGVVTLWAHHVIEVGEHVYRR